MTVRVFLQRAALIEAAADSRRAASTVIGRTVFRSVSPLEVGNASNIARSF